MISSRSMSLILCGDPKQDQQENSLLMFIMIYFGMQLINMTATKLQNKHRERPSFLIKMIHVMILIMILKKKTLQMIKIKMSLHHTQSFNLPSILLHLRNLPKFLFQFWGEFPEAAKQMVIEYNNKIKVVSPKPHFHGGKPKPNTTLGKPNQIHNKFISMRRMILQKISLLKLLPQL